MKRVGLVIGMAAAVGLCGVLAAQDKAKCTCAEAAKSGMGWCAACKHGMAYGMETRFESVYKLIAGAEAPKSKSEFKCKDCLKAMETDGTCSHCKVAFYKGKMYQAMPAYRMAMGMKPDPAKITCEGCKKNLAAHKDGYCDTCSAGLVGGLHYKGKSAYESAVKALAIIKEAMGAKCEGCGKAMLTDGECTTCKVKYKEGKKA